MKTLFQFSLFALLLFLSSAPVFAMMSIESVTAKRAKDPGIELRTIPDGAQVWIEMEFKPQGALKEFQHVSIEIKDGEKFLLGYTPLREQKSKEGAVIVRFMADRDYSTKSSCA